MTLEDDEFLSEDNPCGRSALKIVAKGQAIIAELLRLAKFTPDAFIDPVGAGVGEVVFDLRYLDRSNQDECDRRISASETLLDMDASFLDTHFAFCERVYNLFRTIRQYSKDVSSFVNELNDGIFVQQTLESVLLIQPGRELLSEMTYIYGVMLLLLDYHFEGPVRERLLVAYFRKSGEASEVFDSVCQLCRRTGYSRRSSVRPADWPEALFARAPLPTSFVEVIIGRLRSDDIYNMSVVYPNPTHRSAALSTQAAMLFVLLFFTPATLRNEVVVMREIVDKHFPDNFVIPLYMGHTVDLTAAWAPYKAAAAAIAATAAPAAVSQQAQRHTKELRRCTTQVDALLRDGLLTDEYVLEHIQSVLQVVRESNVCVRWLLLHRMVDSPLIRQIVSHPGDIRRIVECNTYPAGPLGSWGPVPAPTNAERAAMAASPVISAAIAAANTIAVEEEILGLLLGLSRLEYTLLTMFNTLMVSKRTRWRDAREEGSGKLASVAQYYRGDGPLAAAVPEDDLAEWFDEMAETIRSMSYKDATLAGRRVSAVQGALTKAEEIQAVYDNLQVRQFLLDTREQLRRMLLYVNIKPEIPRVVSTVGNLGYAWGCSLERLIPPLQARIKSQPNTLRDIRSIFVKLVSMMEVPLERIYLCESPDQASVETFYSDEVVAFVRRCLDVVPASMFDVVSQVTSLITPVGIIDDLPEATPDPSAPAAFSSAAAGAAAAANKDKKGKTTSRQADAAALAAGEAALRTALYTAPAKIRVEDLAACAQVDVRRALSRCAYDVARYSDGVLDMEKTMLGVAEIAPRDVLENGIRRELVRRVSAICHEMLPFRPSATTQTIEVFETSLLALARALSGMRRAFEYLQDYMAVSGLRLWQSEFSRFIGYCCDMDANAFVKKKIYYWQSRYYRASVPIPDRRYNDDVCQTFLAAIAYEIFNQTSPSRVSYLPQQHGWFGTKGDELIGSRTFYLIRAALGVPGLRAVDRLLGFMVARHIHDGLGNVCKELIPALRESLFERMQTELTPYDSLPPKARELYASMVSHRIFPGIAHRKQFAQLLVMLVSIGRLQLLRRHVASELAFGAHLDARALTSAAAPCDLALRNDMVTTDVDPSTVRYLGKTDLLSDMTALLDNIGRSSAATKPYHVIPPTQHIVPCIVTAIILCLPRLRHDPTYDTVLPMRVEPGEKDPSPTLDRDANGRPLPSPLPQHIDGVALMVGVSTVMWQLHPSMRVAFFALMSQFVRVWASVPDEIVSLALKEKDPRKRRDAFVLPHEATTMISLMSLYARINNISSEAVRDPNRQYIDARVHRTRGVVIMQRKPTSITNCLHSSSTAFPLTNQPSSTCPPISPYRHYPLQPLLLPHPSS